MRRYAPGPRGGMFPGMAKQSPSFGLTQSGRGWFKRIDGKPRWVCSLKEAPTGAQADDVFARKFAALKAGKPPARPSSAPAPMLGPVAELYLDERDRAVREGRLSARSLADTQWALQLTLNALGGLRPLASLVTGDFDTIARQGARYGVHRRLKLAVLVRSFFRWAWRRGFMVEVRDFGDLRPPSKLEMRRARQLAGQRLASPGDVRRLLRHAPGPRWRAMILLALNAGLGPGDLVGLRVGDVKAGFVDSWRAKTAVSRRCPLWPETLAAIAALKRPATPDTLVFVTRDGGRLSVKSLAQSWCKLARRACYGHGLYSLRHTHRTHADHVGDQRAAGLIMGHVAGDVGGLYVERIDDARLVKIVRHVHGALRITSASAAGRVGRARALAKRLARRRAGQRRATSPPASA